MWHSFLNFRSLTDVRTEDTPPGPGLEIGCASHSSLITMHSTRSAWPVRILCALILSVILAA